MQMTGLVKLRCGKGVTDERGVWAAWPLMDYPNHVKATASFHARHVVCNLSLCRVLPDIGPRCGLHNTRSVAQIADGGR